MAYTNLCGKKLQAKLGGCLNESATSHSPALLSSQQSFAKRQLEKMGWEEGTGLGKRRNGIQEHVKTKQREDELGLGREKEMEKQIGNVWWRDSVGGTLAQLQLRQKEMKEKKEKRKKSKRDKEDGEKKKKSKKDKRKTSSKKSSSCSVSDDDDNTSLKETTTIIKTYTDEELFQATGGARFGMRAQRRAEGKWKRTESGTNLVELEKKAKTSIEWNGRGNAQVAVLGEAISSSSVVAAVATCTTSSTSHSTTNKKRKRADDEEANERNGSADVVVDVDNGEQESKQKKKEKKQKKDKKERKSEKSSKNIHKVSPSASEGEEEDGMTAMDECVEVTKTVTKRRKDIEKKKEKKTKKSSKK
ncbi:hypothetical protein ACHAWU_009143 [Discostella pseudostelligera]|uniref:G-patch domain-containing protein n=1 Tax=Discostella pseudostelligera TaxID=259834 RepID=A0ABD3N297_9STRA